MFAGLGDPEKFDACADCLAHLVYQSGRHDGQPLAQVIVPNVMALRPMFEQILKAGDEAEDQARAITRVFVELAEQHAQFVLTATPDALQIMDALLVCGEHPVERIARMSFNFWYHLSEDVTRKENPRHAELMAAFTPCFVRWMTSLIALLRYPEDYDSQPADRQDDFKKFRYAVADAVVDACRVITADVCLERFWHALTELMGADECSWQGVEAVLYGVRSIARFVSKDESVFLPQIMQIIPTLPAHRPLQYTTALMVGATSEWLPAHPEYLGSLFPYLVKLLESPDVADAAALSIKNVCETCRSHFTEESTATSLMQLYEGRTDSLDSTAAIELTQAVTQAVSVMPDHMMVAAMPLLVRTPLAKVQALVPEYARGVTKETSKAMVTALKRLAAIFQVFDEARKDSTEESERSRRFNGEVGTPHPCAEIMAQVWAVLDGVLSDCIANSSTMENACRVIKCAAIDVCCQRIICSQLDTLAPGRYMVATMQLHARPLLYPLLQKLATCFHHQPHSCFLYLCATIVSIFGGSDDAGDQAALKETLTTFTHAVCGEGGLLASKPSSFANRALVFFAELFVPCSRR